MVRVVCDGDMRSLTKCLTVMMVSFGGERMVRLV